MRTDNSQSSMKNVEVILWAVQDLVVSASYVTAGIAPKHMNPFVENVWKVKGTQCRDKLKDGQEIFFSARLPELEHLLLEYVFTRYG